MLKTTTYYYFWTEENNNLNGLKSESETDK